MCSEASYTVHVYFPLLPFSLSFSLILPVLPIFSLLLLLFIIVDVTLTPNGSVVIDYQSNITFTCSFQAHDPINIIFVWSHPDNRSIPMEAIDNIYSNLTLSGLTLADSGNYTCLVVDNYNNTVGNATVLLTVKRKLHVHVVTHV